MSAIVDEHSSRKQRLDVLFNFLTDGPLLPDQNIIEPAMPRLVPWNIAHWKRGLTGVPLHGSALDIDEHRSVEVSDILDRAQSSSRLLSSQSEAMRLQTTSPILRQVLQREEQYASLMGDSSR